jgi:hypothetical protein
MPLPFWPLCSVLSQLMYQTFPHQWNVEERYCRGFHLFMKCLWADPYSSVTVNMHCKDTIPKIRNKYSQERNCAAAVKIPTFMFLWAMYIFPWSVCLFCYISSITGSQSWPLLLTPRVLPLLQYVISSPRSVRRGFELMSSWSGVGCTNQRAS